jgi:hypothetical protein
LFSVRIGLFCRARGKEVRTRVMGESKKSLWHFVKAVVLYYTMSFDSLLSLNQMHLAGQKMICWGFLGWTWIQEVAATRHPFCHGIHFFFLFPRPCYFSHSSRDMPCDICTVFDSRYRTVRYVEFDDRFAMLFYSDFCASTK